MTGIFAHITATAQGLAGRAAKPTTYGQRCAAQHLAMLAKVNAPPPTPAARMLFEAMWRESQK